jgi:hypothetical protein
MLIYQIPNRVVPNTEYVCDSQETIDARPKDKQGNYIIPASQCSVGTQADADTLLATNQQVWLTQQNSLFTCNLQTTVEGGVVWSVVDFNTEPSNMDRQYFVLDPTTGLYTEAIGLDNAKTLLSQTQQKYLVFTCMDKYNTLTSWA